MVRPRDRPSGGPASKADRPSPGMPAPPRRRAHRRRRGVRASVSLGLPSPSIYEYGVVGNLQTAALVSRTGSVDWACLPEFADPCLFGRLVGGDAAGFDQVRPAEPFRSMQRYRPSTNVLETLFELRGPRRLSLIDFMPVASGGRGQPVPMIVRVVSAEGGPVPIASTFAPRFGYSRRAPPIVQGDQEYIAGTGAQQAAYRASWPVEPAGGALVGQATVQPGSPQTEEVAWSADWPTASGPIELLDSTERFWRGWVHSAEAPLHTVAGEWHAWIERSELLLKLLSSERSGAFIAAPTTSLPEWPGAERNWDYRFAWIRDAAFSAEVLLWLGHVAEARAFLEWVIARLSTGEALRVVYDASGRGDLSERTLRGWPGFAASTPVRVGNRASSQFQLDIFGEVLDAAAVLAELDPVFLKRSWPQLSRLGDTVMECWQRPDQGMWEMRGPSANFVHSKLMAWVALDRSVRLAELFQETDRVERWRATAQEIRRAILDRGYDPRRRMFVQAFERPAPDAANLRIPLVGFLPFDDPRVVGTIEGVIEELTDGPFVYRYRTPDGFDSPEGAFLPCSFWLVECLARTGHRARALSHWRRLLQAASPLGLFSEEFDPRRRAALGNYPQAFTHIGVLRAALALGVGELPSISGVSPYSVELPRL